ncbi:MAG: MBL fold metallo-hydrolase [Thermomicrobiales bacterium]|nr:MBL fold metallo-hydrolase [Thermomicrobiales bacterium]
MRLQFLGTSASGGFPNPHCRCENCQAAREAGGKSIRMMCSAMIDGELLIDLGPDLSGACLRFGVDLGDLRWVLQTHDHGDHLLPLHATMRAANWAAKNVEPLEWFVNDHAVPIILAGNEKSLPKLDMTIDQPDSSAMLKISRIGPWQELVFGPYEVLTIPANHSSAVLPMLFAIRKGGRSLLYASDTAELPEGVWPRVAEFGWHFDLVIFDHNDGFMRPYSNTHSGSDGVLQEYARMRAVGLVDESTRLIGTHLAHHSNTIHEVEAERAQALGYDLAYDGMVVDL